MKIISKSVNDTLRLGKLIAKRLKPGHIICLLGDLGTGKTVLAKGIACGLGIKTERVISPTFVLIRQHMQGRLPVYHFDLYRLKNPGDILGLGYEEYLDGDGVTVIEWANKLGYLMPKEFLKINLDFVNNSQRSFKLLAIGRRHKELLKEIYENIRN